MAHRILAVIPRAHFDFTAVTKELARGWVEKVLNHLVTVAERQQTPLDQLACTLLLGIITKTGAIFVQIGDGGWVVEKDDELVPGTWPQNGEFVNTTTFITTKSALESMQFVRIEGRISAVSGFTDGLQALALDFAARQAYSPFFKPMFDSVRACDDETSLIAPLRGFLASELVSARTDDDKTLVLACWRNPDSSSNEVGE